MHQKCSFLSNEIILPLRAPGPAHPSPGEGHLQTLHVQKTEPISGYAGGL